MKLELVHARQRLELWEITPHFFSRPTIHLRITMANLCALPVLIMVAINMGFRGPRCSHNAVESFIVRQLRRTWGLMVPRPMSKNVSCRVSRDITLSLLSCKRGGGATSNRSRCAAGTELISKKNHLKKFYDSESVFNAEYRKGSFEVAPNKGVTGFKCPMEGGFEVYNLPSSSPILQNQFISEGYIFEGGWYI
ncbi:hypothetical protein B0H10DRAFT_1956882 [Mycena sp. CBHHK59/15]|nr:hypothetical protein B0H10DRAFT_1956882 [Mycena sp. CBHHK59/15]